MELGQFHLVDRRHDSAAAALVAFSPSQASTAVQLVETDHGSRAMFYRNGGMGIPVWACDPYPSAFLRRSGQKDHDQHGLRCSKLLTPTGLTAQEY